MKVAAVFFARGRPRFFLRSHNPLRRSPSRSFYFALN